MSTDNAKPDADRLKRLLALAPSSSAADGEAMNALRAARKIVVDLGGFEAAVAAIKDVCKPSQKQDRPSGNGFNAWGFAYGNPFNSQGRRSEFYGGFSGWNEDRQSRANREAQRKQEEADRKARERAERDRLDAEKEAKERREWELRRAMGQGLPVWEALRRRRLWMPGEDIDDGMRILSDEEAAFAKVLNGERR